MFSSVRQFLSRHRRKFIATGLLVGGTALALQYAQRRLREFQERQARDFLERQRRTQHFELTERTCNQAIMGIATSVCDELLRSLDTEPTVQQLRQRPDNRQALWLELKVLAFARLATLVYACSMLVVSLRVQVNVLGGYLYKETTAAAGGAKSAAAAANVPLTAHMQQTYLSLNQHFIDVGVGRMAALIEQKVRSVLADYDLRQELSLADVEQVFWSIQRAVNSDDTDPSGNMARFVLPAELPGDGGAAELGGEDGEQMGRMFAETLDMLESEDAVSLTTYNVTRGFSIVMDSIAEFYCEAEPVAAAAPQQNGLSEVLQLANGGSGVVDITEVCAASAVPITKADLNAAAEASALVPNINQMRVPMAKLIPIVNGLASKAFSASVRPASLSTSLVTLFLVSDKVKTLGANVYEVFSQ